MAMRQKLYKIVFESNTKSGRLFDIFLLWCILLSVIIAMVESIPNLNSDIYYYLWVSEWVFTVLFTIEYFFRIYICSKPLSYIFSLWGLIDLLAFFPTYLSLFYFSSHYLIVIRVLRLLRVYRILRLLKFYKESLNLLMALKTSFHKISVFLTFVVVLVIMLGTLMYVIEGEENGFTSIPQGIYWAIITITTVGYGDVVPLTIMGKFLASITMIIGYAIIAVPTGIVTVEISRANRKHTKCSECHSQVDDDDNYCNNCGKKLGDAKR